MKQRTKLKFVFPGGIEPSSNRMGGHLGTTAHIIFNYNNDPDPDKGIYKTHSANPVIYHVVAAP